jgi:hypothetical protein
MNDLERQVSEVLHNLNWLMEPHESCVELIAIEGRKVVIRCVGHCADCETDCIGTAFRERMPDIELIIQ